jgi:protein tyrosine phosphatase (PTP) superfamily phosphohydrolase (DUF442 family)
VFESPSILPIPNSYWVRSGTLLAGEYPGTREIDNTTDRLRKFIRSGIDTFIDLTQEGEMPSYDSQLQEQAADNHIEVSYTRIPIIDFDIPSIDQMTMILDKVDNSLKAGKKVYVHCWGGVGRTGTAMGCYLIRHGARPQDALNQLSTWWQDVPKRVFHPRTPETDEQIKFILSWKENR